MGYEIRHRLRCDELGVNVYPKRENGSFCIAAQRHFCYRPDDTFAIGTLFASIFIPAKSPHLLAVFALEFNKTSILVSFTWSIHIVLSRHRWLKLLLHCFVLPAGDSQPFRDGVRVTIALLLQRETAKADACLPQSDMREYTLRVPTALQCGGSNLREAQRPLRLLKIYVECHCGTCSWGAIPIEQAAPNFQNKIKGDDNYACKRGARTMVRVGTRSWGFSSPNATVQQSGTP
jgi:hypothetical protein